MHEAWVYGIPLLVAVPRVHLQILASEKRFAKAGTAVVGWRHHSSTAYSGFGW